MNDFGSLIVFLAMMAILSVMDALARRARQRKAPVIKTARGDPVTTGCRDGHSQCGSKILKWLRAITAIY
jgi:hypothetical protein